MTNANQMNAETHPMEAVEAWEHIELLVKDRIIAFLAFLVFVDLEVFCLQRFQLIFEVLSIIGVVLHLGLR